MRSKYDNEFKEMIVKLLISGMKTKQLSQEYDLAVGLINSWRRKYETQSDYFSNVMNTNMGKSVYISSKIEDQKFKEIVELRDRWKEETLFVSSGTLLISNSVYQSVINMGRLTIPWIFREMKKNDDHWFYALEKITGINPIKPENVGKIKKMKKDWFYNLQLFNILAGKLVKEI